jgi:hypothetical protein
VVDHVKPKARGEEVGGGIPIAHVKSHVIQLLYLHLPSFLRAF